MWLQSLSFVIDVLLCYEKLWYLFYRYLRWLSIWRDHQATLASQRVSIFSQNLCCCQAGGDSRSRPNGINRCGLFCPVKGVSHQEAVQIYCTVFVDHFSGLCFMHLQIDDSGAETMLAKQAFEKFVAEHGVRILHYHCDNGGFADNTWKGQPPTTYFLWSECPFPEWNC
jgi:hypothetical protein